MIIYSKRDGYYYKDETTGERFALVELKTLGADLTTDIVGIWDEENNELRGYFSGATLYENDPKQLDELVQEYIEKPHQKPAKPAVSYAFTRAGCKAFCEDVVSEFFEAMDVDKDLRDYNIHVTVGKRTVELPMFADIYEGLCYWFDNIEDFDEEENNG